MAVTRIPIPAAWAKTQEADHRLELSLAEIDLDVRTVNGLEQAGIYTVGDLLQRSREQLLDMRNFGEKTLNSICTALENIGLDHTFTHPEGGQSGA